MSYFTDRIAGTDVVVNLAAGGTTKGDIVAQYNNDMAIFSYLLSTTRSGGEPLTNVQMAQITPLARDAIINLLSLAVNGVVGPVNPNEPEAGTMTHYFTSEMLDGMSSLIQTLQAAGAQINVPNASVLIMETNLRTWLSNAVASPTIENVVQTAVLAGATANKSIQSLIELDYVRTGNQLLSEQLSNLKQYISLTQTALNSLQRLTALHTQLQPDLWKYVPPTRAQYSAKAYPSIQAEFYPVTLTNSEIADIVTARYTAYASALAVTNFNFNMAGNASQITRAYLAVASNYFGRPITATFTSATDYLYGSFTQKQNQLLSQLKLIKATISMNLKQIKAAAFVSNSTSDPQTLVGRLSAVLDDLNTAVVDRTSAFNWLMDGYANASGAAAAASTSGRINQTISEAITAGQSVNTTQQENVRQFLFIFEEYYKSASSILQSLTQIIQQMAQAISRG